MPSGRKIPLSACACTPGRSRGDAGGLRRALDGEAQLRVAYRTMPGMSLPVQVLDGRAADLLVERLPGDGDWAGRFARESTRLAAAPLGGKASRCWRSACCWTPPERRSRGCC